jgi:hypothetical protein
VPSTALLAILVAKVQILFVNRLLIVKKMDKKVVGGAKKHVSWPFCVIFQ